MGILSKFKNLIKKKHDPEQDTLKKVVDTPYTGQMRIEQDGSWSVYDGSKWTDALSNNQIIANTHIPYIPNVPVTQVSPLLTAAQQTGPTQYSTLWPDYTSFNGYIAINSTDERMKAFINRIKDIDNNPISSFNFTCTIPHQFGQTPYRKYVLDLWVADPWSVGVSSTVTIMLYNMSDGVNIKSQFATLISSDDTISILDAHNSYNKSLHDDLSKELINAIIENIENTHNTSIDELTEGKLAYV